ncbi:hypothetical protein [Aquirufa ecclesiirivi]|uniref:hypothetical protein n=1 Tax=Aquirufa ecclesiirivi TaxID=2715124 RepID=UPI00140A08BB|nr:hypothetical protein [Aquirufa ecclesiirivi]NHC48584.1 hypothetical protein [Aquirufa ecclesiirivi]
MHPFLLNLWLSSVPLWVGLSLAFFIGLAYYWFQNKSHTHRLIYGVQGFLRGLFLVGIVLCFIPWKIVMEESTKLPSKILLIIDDSQSMNLASYTEFINLVSKDVQTLNTSSSELNVLGLNKGGKNMDEITPHGEASSWAKVQEWIRKESKNYHLSHVFFVTDGQLSDLESPIHHGPKIHIIPFGKEISAQKIGLNFPTKTLVSVPGERVHVPISVWSNLKLGQKSPNIQVLIDGKLHQTIRAQGGVWKDFQQIDLELVSKDIGTHRIRIQMEHDSSLGQGFTWIIQEFQAKVEAFAIAPNPNLGVINRVAKDAKIKIHWNFGSDIKTLPNSDNYLFYGILPKEFPKDKSVWFLNIPNDIKQDRPPFEEFTKLGNYFPSIWKKFSEQRTSLFSSNASLWKEQMAEMKSTGSFRLLDSSLHEMFKISFLRQANDLFSIELAKPQVSMGEDVLFEMRQLNSDLTNSKNIPVHWKISSANSTNQFNRIMSEAHQMVNFKPKQLGKYQYQAKVNYQGKDVEFTGEFYVLDSNPEKLLGRNSIALQVLSHREGVDLVESTEIKKMVLDNKLAESEVSIKEISLWEWPYFGAIMLGILGIEWIIRKRLNQL